MDSEFLNLDLNDTHFSDHLRDTWTIFQYSLNVIKQSTEKLLSDGWKPVRFAVPLMLEPENHDDELNICGWSNTFRQLELYILIDHPHSSDDTTWPVQPSRLAPTPAGINQIICDLRGINKLPQPIPQIYNERFMILLPHITGTMQTVWCPDHSMPWAQWTLSSDDYSVISRASDFLKSYCQHSTETLT